VVELFREYGRGDPLIKTTEGFLAERDELEGKSGAKFRDVVGDVG
jgi:hypothetical protein